MKFTHFLIVALVLSLVSPVFAGGRRARWGNRRPTYAKHRYHRHHRRPRIIAHTRVRTRYNNFGHGRRGFGHRGYYGRRHYGGTYGYGYTHRYGHYGNLNNMSPGHRPSSYGYNDAYRHINHPRNPANNLQWALYYQAKRQQQPRRSRARRTSRVQRERIVVEQPAKTYREVWVPGSEVEYYDINGNLTKITKQSGYTKIIDVGTGEVIGIRK